MRSKLPFPLLMFLVLVLLSVTVATLAAQGDCPTVVKQALDAATLACSSLSRNTACYGNNRVIATGFDGAELPDFTLPGNTADLLNLGGLATFPFDTADNTWGVAVLAVQADLPDTL